MVDGILLGNTAAWTTQPTGLLNGLTPLAATAGGGVNALLGDIQKPLAAIAPAIKPVLIVNSTQAASTAVLAQSPLPVITASYLVADTLRSTTRIAASNTPRPRPPNRRCRCAQ